MGVGTLPPMNDTVEDIQSSKETFIGFLHTDFLVGFIAYEHVCNTVVITRLAVDPALFNQGIASSLLQHVLHLQTEMFEVTTGAENEPAIQLYQKHGFHITGIIIPEPEIQLVRLIHKKSS